MTTFTQCYGFEQDISGNKFLPTIPLLFEGNFVAVVFFYFRMHSLMSRKFFIKKKGMTLIELLIVVAIIGLLATIGIPLYGRLMEQAKDKKMITELRNLAVAIGIYKVDNDLIPDADSATELVAILKADQGAASPYMDTDPWGNPYDYIRSMATNSYTLRCRGKDGIVGNLADEANFNADNDTVLIDGLFIASHQGAASIAR